MNVVRLPSFWRDLQDIVDYFHEIKEVGRAIRFAKAVDATIALIASFPDIGSPWESADPRLSKLRYFIVKRFRRHLIVYENVQDGVVIHRLFHARQNIEDLLKG